MSDKNFTRRYTVAQSPEEIYQQLLDVRQWWTGLYEETIEGKSAITGDEFDFHAGQGMHYSRQKLVEAVPGKKLTWLVTGSTLSFLKNEKEWTGTSFGFELSEKDKGTEVVFTHTGLSPASECYKECSTGWTGYLEKFFTPLAVAGSHS